MGRNLHLQMHECVITLNDDVMMINAIICNLLLFWIVRKEAFASQT